MRILYTRKIWVIAITVWLAASAVVIGQPVARVIDVGDPCRSCVLRVEKVTRLSDPASGMGSSSNLTSIDRDSRGRYWVADYGARTNVLVFGPDGILIRRIGREGSGPGEFRRLEVVLVGRGDTVHAFDGDLRRRADISPTTLEVIAHHPVANVPFSMMLLQNGNFLGNSRAPDQTGHLFEELDRKGNRVRAFGGDGKNAPSYTRAWLSRRLIPDGRDGFYALNRRNYFIEHWDANGTLTATWERKAEWFPEWPAARVNPSLSGRSGIFAAWVSADGLLFVGSHVRQKGWEKALVTVKDERGNSMQGVEDYHQYYDSIIEVIDPRTSRLLASLKHDLSFTWSAANGEIYIRGEDPEEHIDIYRVTFTRR